MKTAKLKINRDYKIGKIEREVFSSFIEHMGRAVYNGIYEPTHNTANKHGFRKDVIDVVKELHVPIVRYPGGNFLSGYDWKDGIGPMSERKAKLDLAWGQLEPNKVGILEFDKWAKEVGTDIMMSVNMGTGTPKDAGEIVEYCNHDSGSYWSDKRIAHGKKEALGIKYWCIGNEMDGDWQICMLTPDEYGRKAVETAKIMKWVDKNIELVICGSSGPHMPSYPMWDRKVLEHTYNYVDYISLHRYYEYPQKDKSRLNDFLASYVNFDAFIKTVASTCDYVKAVTRSNKTMKLSIDEWNIWHTDDFNCTEVDRWTVGPVRVENNYDMADALAMAGMMLTLINNADRVKMACLAQLINVIAPVLTRINGDVLKQTIYYPFMCGSLYAKGDAMRTIIECEKISTKEYGDADSICSATSYDEETGEITVFMLNNNIEDNCAVNICFEQFGEVAMISHISMSSDDPHTKNTFENKYAVVPQAVKVDEDKKLQFEVKLEKLSFNVLRFKV